METSFRTRVDRAFGYLLGSNLNHHHQGGADSDESTGEQPQSSAATVAGLEFWSVSERAITSERFARTGDDDTGDESDDNTAADYRRFVRLERRGRRRRRDDLTTDEPEEDDSEEERRERKRRREREFEGDVGVERTEVDEEDEEVREMRRMIGRDCTLDFEEEEDEYDKVAVGREGAGDRMYMKEIRGSCLDICHLPPGHSGALGTFKRDSRANHEAAAARLQEDKEAEARYNSTASIGSSLRSQAKLPSVSNAISCLKRRLSDGGISKEGADLVGEKNGNRSEAVPAIVGVLGNTNKINDACREQKSSGLLDESEKDSTTGRSNLRRGSIESCMKNEDCSTMMRKEKRARTVRFAVADDSSEEKRQSEREVLPDENRRTSSSNHIRIPSTVPDHVRNPSKYTHYTLEWSDDEDDSKKNLTAFHSFKALPQAEKPDVRRCTDLPQSITFTPKFSGSTVKAQGTGVEKSKKDSSSAQVQPSVSFVEAVLDDDSKSSEVSVLWSRSGEGKTARVFRKRASATAEDDVDKENTDSSS